MKQKGLFLLLAIVFHSYSFSQEDASFFMTPTCDGAYATITGDPGGFFALNPAATDDATLDLVTGVITNATSGATYTIEYTTSGPAPETSSESFTVLLGDEASFYMTPTCDGGFATITGTAGGTFAFNPTPPDGVAINSVTGEVLYGIPGTTYFVEYTTDGSCPDTSTEAVTILSVPEIIEPTPLEICASGGVNEFDLTSKVDEILNGAVDVSITFHPEYSDASNNLNALNSPYINTVNMETIYVRGEDVIHGCYTIVELNLIVLLDCRDMDDDGVVNSDEDINENGDLDDDDTDQDSIPNYLDDDDDGDNVNTLDEINMESGRTLHNFIDTDGDLIEDYLDDDDDGDGILTVDEDYNNNGDPTDDDTDFSGIPDYLESNVALSLEEFSSTPFSMYPNPANNIVNVQFKNSISGIVYTNIYDIQGKLVAKTKHDVIESKMQFDVSNLSQGMYFVALKTDNFEVIEKLIIH